MHSEPTPAPIPFSSGSSSHSSSHSPSHSRGRRSHRSPRSAGWHPETVTEHPIHSTCDLLTEIVLCFMLVFSPWAFGTTQPWSVWTMNICGYTLGILWINKLVCRRMLSGHWSIPETEPETETDSTPSSSGGLRFLIPTLGALTVLTLIYCLIAALNVRAVYNWTNQTFDYHDSYIPWLPMSYDGPSSMQVFWNALALALTFWSIIDWMRMGALDAALAGPRYRHSEHLIQGPPDRVRRLLWLMAIHGAVLTAICMIQRADGGAKLLWIQETRINQEAVAQFGPYAYRSNAAQYLNLLWPVVLGFWWWLDRSTPKSHSLARTRSLQHMLLPMAGLIAVGPIISMSRAGALVGVATTLAAGGLFIFAGGSRRWKLTTAVVFGVVMTIAAALYINGDKLIKRFESSKADFLQGREVTYQLARKITEDYPWFGTGPGTFDSVFSLYRDAHDDYWPSQLHNDWLEILITFGRVGFVLLFLLMCGSVLHSKFGKVGVKTPWLFTALLWIAMGGCLVHARGDFPFQIYSIQLLFIALCAMLASMQPGRTAKPEDTL